MNFGLPMSLIYAALLGGGVYFFFILPKRRLARARGAAQAPKGARFGPIPGYSFLPAGSVRFDPDNPPPGLGSEWEPVSVETVHAGRRSRILLTLKDKVGLSDADLFNLMKGLATRLLQRTRSIVGAVQVVDDAGDTVVASMVLATDGRGWTGTTTDASITASLPERPAFRMHTGL